MNRRPLHAVAPWLAAVLVAVSLLVGSCGEQPLRGIEVEPVTRASATAGGYDGVAYWVPLTDAIDSLPFEATDTDSHTCSQGQVDWLNAHGSRVLFPQEAVITSFESEPVTLTIHAAANDAPAATTPGFYVQCGRVLRESEELIVTPSPGPVQWQQVRVSLDDATATATIYSDNVSDPPPFEAVLQPGQAIGLRMFLTGTAPFTGRLEVSARGPNTTRVEPIPVLSVLGESGPQFSWPGIPTDTLLLHPGEVDDDDGVTRLMCDPRKEGGWSEGCSAAGVAGLVARIAQQPQTLADYLSRRLGASSCANPLGDQAPLTDAWRMAVDSYDVAAAGLPVFVTEPIARLSEHCSAAYLAKVLHSSGWIRENMGPELDRLRTPSEPPAGPPPWAACASGTVRGAVRWDGPPSGSLVVCSGKRAVLEVSGEARQTFDAAEGFNGEIGASNTSGFLDLQPDPPRLTLTDLSGKSRSFDVTEVWWSGDWP